MSSCCEFWAFFFGGGSCVFAIGRGGEAVVLGARVFLRRDWG